MRYPGLTLYTILVTFYWYFAQTLGTAEDITLLTAVYIGCTSLLKVWTDRGVYLSLYHLFAVAYFYYIAKEIWFYNPMLSEFMQHEIAQAVRVISIATVLVCTALACSSNRARENRTHDGDNAPQLYLNKWVTLLIFAIYVSLMAVPAYLTMSLGRTAVYGASFASIGLLVPFLNAFGYLLPAFLHLSFRGSATQNVLKFAMITLVFLIQVGIGNRFVILFSFFIYISLLVDVRRIGFKNAVLPAVLLSFLSVVMGTLRTASTDITAGSESAVSSEGIVYYMSGLVRFYTEHHHSFLPIYSSFSTYFLVPRAIWPDKPELIGSWLLDTGVFVTRFSEGHSGSVSFVGPFFADFGYLYFLPMLVLAVILVKLDRFLAAHVGEYSAKGIIAASLVPLVFFGYRSFNTSVAAELILVLLVFLVVRFNQLRIDPYK